jgi:eukaryotic-like serine/threonine-protein kinase
MMGDVRHVRLFVASPTDVAEERKKVQWIVDRMNGEYAHAVRFETVLWEDAVYGAHGEGYQSQIVKRAKPADCEIVLGILWKRLGSPLPGEFPEKMPDGRPYASGTAYEILSALETRKANGHRPDVFVFRNIAGAFAPLFDEAAQEEANYQWKLLESFYAEHFETPDKRIVRIAEKYADLADFERKVAYLLRDWIKTNVPEGTVWPVEAKGSPFRGLAPFDAKHADIYFGRGRKVQRALDELTAAAKRGTPFLLIPGASGSGKSSLMRAGIAPRLVQPGRVQTVDVWRTAVTRPGSETDPMLAIARALFVTGDAQKDDPGGFGRAVPELAGGAFKTPEVLSKLFAGDAEIAVKPLVAALDQIGEHEARRRKFTQPVRANLLLLVDQLEDIFAADVTAIERSRFATLLAAMVNTQRIWVVATIRGDMYERVITERPFIALKDNGGQYDLSPPGADELDEIVHRSAAATGLQYEVRPAKDPTSKQPEDRLDDRLLRDAAGENTLPLLEFALDLLFEKCWVKQRSKVLTISAYEEFGGLDGAINQTAEMALARMVSPNAEIAYPLPKEIQVAIEKDVDSQLESLLRKLVVPVGPGGRAFTANIVPMEVVRTGELANRLIDALLRARILLALNTEHESQLRIAHDRVMTSWERARVLIERNRDFYRVKEAVENQRQRWEDNKRSAEFLIAAGAPINQAEEKVRQFPEEFSADTKAFVAISGRRARFRSRLTAAAAVVFAVVAVIALGMSWYATRQKKLADNAANVANEQKSHAIESEKHAEESYRTARDVVKGLIASIANKLRDVEGIRVDTISTALRQVSEALARLEKENSGDLELKSIRASMNFEFAKVFQQNRELPLALSEGTAGLEIRKRLAAGANVPQEWTADFTASLDQVGDIRRDMALRLKAKNPGGAQKELETAYALYDQAYDIRKRLSAAQPESSDWSVGLSNSLVRMGDVKMIAGTGVDVGQAIDFYQRGLAKMLEVVRREPNSDKWLRELSWEYKKFGDILEKKASHPEAVKNYACSLCIRRYLLEHDKKSSLLQRDIAYALESIGKASAVIDPTVAWKAWFQALTIRRTLVKSDPNNALWRKELAATLRGIGDLSKQKNHPDAADGFYCLAREEYQYLADRAGVGSDAAAEYKKAIGELKVAEQVLKKDWESQTTDAGSLSEEYFKKVALDGERKLADTLKQQAGDPVAEWNHLKSRILAAN